MKANSPQIMNRVRRCCLRACEQRRLCEIAQGDASVRLAVQADNGKCLLPVRQGSGIDGSGPDFAAHLLDEGICAVAGNEGAVFHDRVLTGDHFHIGDNVGGDEHDASLRKFCKQVAKAHTFAGVQAACWFVENQHLGLVQQRLRNADAPFHAAGEFDNAFAAHIAQAEPLQKCVDAVAGVVFAQAFESRHIVEIVADGEAGIEAKLLRQIAKAVAVAFAQLGDRHTVKADVALAGPHDAGGHAH